MVQENSLKKILIICGPTASGKTALAVSCAKLLDSPVISADSMNVYKDFNIGTAKPTESEKEGVKHYLIDVCKPSDTFSVGDYKEIAKPIVESVIKDGKIPVICGGTGFYINSLIYDYSYGNVPADLSVREKYFKLAKKYGNEYVFKILQEKDYESSLKIHCNDLKRVIRALEIFENGNRKSDIKDELTPVFSVNSYAIDYPREELYRRIDLRVDNMIKAGLVEEVKGLMDKGINLFNQSMQGIGYKEIYSYLSGEISLDNAIEQIKLNSRHYAKRQITFFKKMPNLTMLKPDDYEVLAKRIVDNL